MSLRSEVIRIVNELLGNSKKISELPAASVLTGSELVEIVQNGVNCKETVSALSGGSIISGSIIYLGEFDLSVSNLFPNTGGTGIAGTWQKGNQGVNTVSTTSLKTAVNQDIIAAGATITAKIDNPSTTDSNDWIITYNAI